MSNRPSFLILDEDRATAEDALPREQDDRDAAPVVPDHVLVIDDEPDMLGLYRACLSAHGYRVTAASDGAAGLDLAAVDRPALILMDLRMPGMDGLEVCRRIRGDTRTADIPVLMVSGSGDVEDRIAALRDGSDDFLTKPFEYEELVARVEALIRRSARHTRNPAAELSPDDLRRLQILRRALRDGPESLIPSYSPRTASGFAYPAAFLPANDESAADPIEDLEFLHERGYLERTFHDVVLACPYCDHHDIHLREVCPACGSADLRPVEMIHHYRCAFVGPADSFRQGNKMVCPKCRVPLRHIGLEYETPTDTVQCGGCDRGFQEPDVAARCRACAKPFPPEQAERKRIFAYGLTASGRFAAEVGSFMDAPGAPDFTESETEVYRPEFFQELVSHEVARGVSMGHGTGLLRVGVRGIEKLGKVRGPAAARRALRDVVRHIRSVVRQVDKVGRMRGADFLVLVPGADVRVVVSLARRIAEAFSASDDENLSRLALSYSWAVHPQDGDDARDLLNHALEGTATARLGSPDTYAEDAEQAERDPDDRRGREPSPADGEAHDADEAAEPGDADEAADGAPETDEDIERSLDAEFDELLGSDPVLAPDPATDPASLLEPEPLEDPDLEPGADPFPGTAGHAALQGGEAGEPGEDDDEMWWSALPDDESSGNGRRAPGANEGRDRPC